VFLSFSDFSSVKILTRFALLLEHDLFLDHSWKLFLPKDFISLEHVGLTSDGRNGASVQVSDIDTLVFVEWDRFSSLENFDLNLRNVLSWTSHEPSLTS